MAPAPAPIPLQQPQPVDPGPPAVLTFRLVNPPDPFTGEYWQPSGSPVGAQQLARSAGWGRLCFAIQRYVQWQSSGRSFLVAGHRGSGKTTMVESAIESVRRSSLESGSGRRPLFVRVHGPDLFPPNAAQAATPAAPAPPPADAKSHDSAGKKTRKSDQPEIDSDPLLENVLKQICIALYRSAANEFIVSYRERVHRRAGLADWQSAEYHEMAAQLAHDIDDSLSLDQLRDYWERIGLLSKGVLFAQPEDGVDQGALEIIALSLAGQAYQVVSGKWDDKRSDDSGVSQSSTWSLATAAEVKNLLAPFIGLFTGTAVFASMPAENRIGGVVLGLLSALAISFSMSYSGTRSRDRKITRKNTFAKDRTLSSLGRALPQLVVQFRRCGLHPVFVVDELDKVESLPMKMRQLISYLKDFASDRALFCFLTDRDYLEFIEQETAGNAYVPEYSYFRDRIPVFYQPEDLRTYLFSVFDALVSPDYELLTYSLLHRARLHPIDLRRELSNLGDGSGNVSLKITGLREGSRTFELLLQLAVEFVLKSPELQQGIRDSASFAQLAVDVLYYPSRSWANGDENLDTSDTKVMTYLALRLHPAKEGETVTEREPEGLSGRDRAILLLAVRRVVYHLEDPVELVRLVRYERAAGSGPTDMLLDLVPQGERFRLLKKLETDKWEWRFNAYGQVRRQVGIRAVTEGTHEDRDLVDGVNQQVLKWTSGINLGLLAAETGVPTISPQWSRVRLALDRVGKLMSSDTPYPEMTDDKLAIEEYAAKLKPRSVALGQTLCCLAALHNSFDRVALDTMHAELALKGLSDDPAVRIGAIYQTLRDLRPALAEIPSLEDAGLAAWSESTGKQLAIAAGGASDEVRKQVWTRWFSRFDDYFRTGKTIFETAFEDLWTRIDPQAGDSWARPVDLRVRLADVTLSGWEDMLVRSAGIEKPSMPPYLYLAAASLLGLTKLAKRIAAVPAPELLASPAFDDWARTVMALKETKRASLLLVADTQSLYSAWTVSPNYPVLYIQSAHFTEFAEFAARLGITRPQDIGIDRLFVELVGDAASLAASLKAMPGSLASIAGPPLAKAILNLPCTCLLPEAPAETSEKAACPYVVAPSSMDDLMSKLSPRMSSTA